MTVAVQKNRKILTLRLNSFKPRHKISMKMQLYLNIFLVKTNDDLFAMNRSKQTAKSKAALKRLTSLDLDLGRVKII